jgi:hypothetical protein
LVPHSLNGAYSDGGSQVLWHDGERVFRRGWRLDDNGKRRAVLMVLPAADHPSRPAVLPSTHIGSTANEMTGPKVIRDPRWHKQNQCVMNRQQSTSISGKHEPENHRIAVHSSLASASAALI